MLVVAIGSSAGGIEPLGRLLKGLPLGQQLAVIVAQHLAPTRFSMMVEILRPLTALQVINAQDGQPLVPDTVHVTPAGFDIRIVDGRIRIVPPPRRVTPSPSVDQLFESLADSPEWATRTVGLVLSGLGWDGSVGVRALRQAGAITLAQTPGEATAPGMPESALCTGCIDAAAPVTRLAAIVTRLARVLLDPVKPLAATSLDRVSAVMERWGDLPIARFDATRVTAALARRGAISEAGSFDGYIDLLGRDGEEAHALFRMLLEPHGSFDLDAPGRAGLRQVLVEAYRRHTGPESFRVWDVGCAGGESTHALVIALAETRERESLATEFTVYGTDVLPDRISAARLGTFTEPELRGLSPDLVVRYFAPRARFLQFRPPPRSQLLFAVHDVVADPPLPGMHFVACTNVLDSFRSSIASKVRANLAAAVVPGGRVFTGPPDLPRAG